MKRKEFKERLKRIGSNQKKFAALSGCGYSTVKSWEVLPKWATLIVMYMELAHNLHYIDEALISIERVKEEVLIPDFIKMLDKSSK